MSRKLPRDIKPKQIIKALERLGFVSYKGRGSHLRLKHPDGRWTQVAVHPKTVSPGILNKILRQANITVETLLEIL